MENQNKLNYATLHFAIDDLQLIDEALNELKKSRISLGSYKKDDIDRLSWQIHQILYPEQYEGFDSPLMNS